MQTDEENTRWVEVWAVNSTDYHGQLQGAATDGPEALRELVEKLWDNPPEDTPEYYQAREMAREDYDRVDWTEVATTLLDGATPWLDDDEDDEDDEEVAYPAEEWDEAVTAWSSGDTSSSDLDTPLSELDEQDTDTIRACVVAAHELHGPEWTVEEFRLVVQSFAASYGDGWAGLGADYLDDHFPGLPTQWLKDLNVIGQDVKRASEQYVLLDGVLYVFSPSEGN